MRSGDGLAALDQFVEYKRDGVLQTLGHGLALRNTERHSLWPDGGLTQNESRCGVFGKPAVGGVS